MIRRHAVMDTIVRMDGWQGHDTDYFSGNREHGRPVERYVYCNEQGELHQRKIRTSTKNFWQEIWEGGRWIKGAPKVKYLYGIRELLAAPPHEPIWIAEGEKDTNTLDCAQARWRLLTPAGPASGIAILLPSR